MSDSTRPRRLIAWVIGVAILCLAGLVLLWRNPQRAARDLRELVLAIGFSPAVRWLERRRITSGKRRGSALGGDSDAVCHGARHAPSCVLALVIPPVVSQAQELVKQMPTYVEQVQNGLKRAHVWSRVVPMSELLRNFENGDMAGNAFKSVLGAVQGVFGVIGTVVTLLLLPYYLLVESDDLSRELLRLLPMKHRARALRLARDVTTKVGAWLSGQLLLSLLIMTTTTIALWLLGVPYFYVLGVIAGFGEIVPVIGPLAAALPAVFMGLTVSLHTAIFVAIYFIGAAADRRQRARPAHHGASGRPARRRRWSIALLIGTELLGVVGALLAVPTAAIVQVLLQEFLGPEHHGARLTRQTASKRDWPAVTLAYLVSRS